MRLIVGSAFNSTKGYEMVLVTSSFMLLSTPVTRMKRYYQTNSVQFTLVPCITKVPHGEYK